LNIEHFLFGLDEHGNYFLHKSRGVNNIISDENLHRLRENKPTPNDEIYYIPSEKLIAIQHVKDVVRKQRVGVWNHTLLIPVSEYIRDNDPLTKYSRFFIKEVDDPPSYLEPITIEETP
jgi:hypothetical protein